MTTLLYTGLGDLLPVLQTRLQNENYRFRELEQVDISPQLKDADMCLVGPADTNPIKTVQMIHGADKYISILVLVHPGQFAKVKQSLLFSPFVGKNSLCVAYTDTLDVRLAFHNAAQRTRQRRSFSVLSHSAQEAMPLDSNTVRVENLGIFLEQAPIGALLLEEQENVIAINRRARRVFDVEEGRTYSLKDFFPGLSLQELKVRMPLQGGSEGKVVRVKERFLELNLSEVRNDSGRTLYILLLNDITEQRKRETALMESEALFRFTAEAMPQKVWMAGEKGELTFFNQHWYSYTGLTMEELKGWGWLQTLHPDDAERNREEWMRAVQTGDHFEFEQRIRGRDNRYRWHLARGIARRDASGAVTMWIGTHTDIHEQKAFTEELESRVKERTYELEVSNSELEQFVYVTSHDLQEPMRKIRLFSEMLLESRNGIDPETFKYLGKINETAQRMSSLLIELLNFTQLSREEQFVHTDLNVIVAQCLVDLELVIDQSGAAIYTDPLPKLPAIPVQMHQLFYNLVNNAMKFAKPGIAPQIRITAQLAGKNVVSQFPHLDQGRHFYRIIVSDNGIGFSQEHAQQIFQIFQRLHSRSEYSGTGIGLALCKKVVTNHYGEIYAQSQPGEGAAFHILLPAGGDLKS